MTTEQALRHLRERPECQEIIFHSYLTPDLQADARRFASSAEFRETLRLLGGTVTRRTVLDLGAGRGIAAVAFAREGAAQVYALEPDSSREVGRGAIGSLRDGLSVQILDALGEAIPLAGATCDYVYTRQTLHHVQDLNAVLRECARVLKPGGLLFACREHVVDNEAQLKAFQDCHPMHPLTQAEKAFRLDEYLDAIRSAGLHVKRVLRPFDSVINAFPIVHGQAELATWARRLLAQRWGVLGTLAGRAPGIPQLVLHALSRRRLPGRLYSFLALR